VVDQESDAGDLLSDLMQAEAGGGSGLPLRGALEKNEFRDTATR